MINFTPKYIFSLWLVNSLFLYQTSDLLNNLLFTFISLVAFIFTSVLMFGTYYWYTKASETNEKILELIKENNKLKNITLRNFEVKQTSKLSDILNERLVKDEILQMMFDLNIRNNWDNDIKTSTLIRNILVYLNDRGMIGDIEAWLIENRSDIEINFI